MPHPLKKYTDTHTAFLRQESHCAAEAILELMPLCFVLSFYLWNSNHIYYLFSSFMLFNSFHFVMFCFEMEFLYFAPGFKRWSCCSFLGASTTDVPYIPSATVAGWTLLIYFLLLLFFKFVCGFFFYTFYFKIVCCVGTWMPAAARREHWIPWSCSDTWLWVALSR